MSNQITNVCGDLVQFLDGFGGSIDLLYLDSMDCLPQGDATEAQEHTLGEMQAALPKLSRYAAVLLDDNRFAHGGKTRLAKQYLYGTGWTCLFDWHQSLWTRRCDNAGQISG